LGGHYERVEVRLPAKVLQGPPFGLIVGSRVRALQYRTAVLPRTHWVFAARLQELFSSTIRLSAT